MVSCKIYYGELSGGKRVCLEEWGPEFCLEERGIDYWAIFCG